METIVIIVLLVAMAVGVVWYLVRAKKCGRGCVGCLYAAGCRGNCEGHRGYNHRT